MIRRGKKNKTMEKKTVVIIIRDTESDVQDADGIAVALAVHGDTDTVVVKDRFIGERGKLLNGVRRFFYRTHDGIREDKEQDGKENRRIAKKLAGYYRNIYKRFVPDLVLCLSPLAVQAMLSSARHHRFAVDVYGAGVREFNTGLINRQARGYFVPAVEADKLKDNKDMHDVYVIEEPIVTPKPKEKGFFKFFKKKPQEEKTQTVYDVIAEKVHGILFAEMEG